MDTSSAFGTGSSIIMGIIWLAVVIFLIASLWKVFTKAGQPGWGSLIPIYNTYLLLKVAGKPGWWLILFFIPLVNLIIGIIMMLGIAENFGKSTGFAVGLILIPIVFIPILGFGDAKYVGEAVTGGAIQPDSTPPVQE